MFSIRNAKYILFFILIFQTISIILYYSRWDQINYIGFVSILIILVILFKNHFFTLNFNRKILFLIIIIFSAVLLHALLYLKINFNYNYEEHNFKTLKLFYLGIILLLILLFYLFIKIKVFNITHKRIIFLTLSFLLIFVIYLMISVTTITIDTINAKFLPYSLLYQKDININEFVYYEDDNDINKDLFVPGQEPIKGKDGNYYYVFPILPGFINFVMVLFWKILGIPIVSLRYITIYENLPNSFIIDYFEPYQVERMNASFLAVLSLVIFYKILGLLKLKINSYHKLLMTFIYGFTTTHWSISSMILWQHTFIELFVLLMIYLTLRYFYNNYILFFIGIIHGILFYIRPTTIFFIVGFYILFIIWQYRFLQQVEKNNKEIQIKIFYKISLLLSGSLVIVIPLAILNQNIYGNIIGGYLVVLLDPNKNDVQFSFNHYFNNLLGILFSPNYGLFAFHPYFLFGFILAIFYLIKNYKKNYIKLNYSPQMFIITLSLFSIVMYLLFYSSNVQWTGFYNYGPRMMTDIMPFLLIIFIYLLYKIKSSITMFKMVILGILFFTAFIIQYYGNISQNLLGDWYCDVHQKKYLHIDIERKVWDIKDLLLFHKIYFRSKPVYKDITVYQGYKICSQTSFADGYSLLISKKKNNEYEKFQSKIKVKQELNPYKIRFGDYLGNYYFFIDKESYSMNINISSPNNQNQELRIIIKQNERILDYTFNLNHGENTLCINLKGEKNRDRIYLYFFSKNYDEILLKDIVIMRNKSCN